ncbi:MAG: cell division protein ZapA [Nitrospinales bacterium]
MGQSTQIEIFGKKYSIKNSSPLVKPEELAAYVDSKMRELSKIKAGTPAIDLAILAALNIAQEMMELKQQTQITNNKVENKINSLMSMMDAELKQLEVSPRHSSR